MLTINERTIAVSIDTEKCGDCQSKACIAACEKYARGMLRLKDGIPTVEHLSLDEVQRLGTECLACEYECLMRGKNATAIDVPIEGLDDYLAKRQLA